MGKGKRRPESYEEVVNVILECAKDFWLSDVPGYNGSADPRVIVKPEIPEEQTGQETQPLENEDTFLEYAKAKPEESEPKFPDGFMEEDDFGQLEVSDTEPIKVCLNAITESAVEPSPQIPSTSAQSKASAPRCTPGDLVLIKRQLGGFYLTYLMYFKQPYKGCHRILIGAEDLEAIKKLESKIPFLTPKIQEQYDLMMFRMKFNHGFQLVAFPERVSLVSYIALLIYLYNKKRHP